MNIAIKPFSTPGGYYVYNRETNGILSVDLNEYEMFQRIYKKVATDEDHANLKTFQERGFRIESKLKKIEHPQNKFIDFHLENKIEKITLQVTQDCNLRCAYCSYSGGYDQRTHSNKMMSYETMQKSVDFLMQRSMNSKRVDIGFYGGEPLLMFHRIKKLFTYIEQTYPYKEISYSLTTNGTIFTDKVIDFLSEKGVNVTISIDGPKEIHDKNRVFKNNEGSFDLIMKNLEKIRENHPSFFKKISFSTVIAPGNDYKCVDDFYNASEVMEDNLIFTSSVNEFNSKDEVTYDEQYFVTYNLQKMRMLLAMLGFLDEEKISKLFTQTKVLIGQFHDDLGKLAGLGEIGHPGGPCIPGARRPMVDVDGNLFPCERVSESSDNMKIGNIESGFDLEKVKGILNIGQITEQECLNCWNFLNCAICAVATDDTTIFSRKEKLNRCRGEMNETLSMLETICLLKENGFDFEKESQYG